VARAAFGARGAMRAADVTDAINVQRLHGLVIGRMKALGLAPVLEAARTNSQVDAEWVTALSSDIERLLP
jgi:hypothetical protein